MEGFRKTNAITQFAEVLLPGDSEPPILSPEIRQSIRQWMVEINAEEELKGYGLKPRRTAMLSGPPGCGKTTLAHHFAARLGLPLVLVNMASLISSYIGQTGQNINQLFDAIQQQGDKCVLFLDEFDSLGLKRTNETQSGSRERNSIVIALLQKIDQFTGILIAATNLGGDIDPAIWRRFGIHLDIAEPEEEARFAILKRYLSPLTLPEETMNFLTKATMGASPAILRQLMEGIKRDIVLAKRYEQDTGVEAVFRRILFSVRPHSDATLPPLWKIGTIMDDLKKISWPPVDPREKTE